MLCCPRGDNAAVTVTNQKADLSIWGFAFGYFACYAPYSALTKHVTSPPWQVDGVALLPVSVLASLLGMFAFISGMGWWRYAGKWRIGGLRIPRPGRWTFLSGLCTAAIVATTTLAYTFEGTSIVFMMLLMRGGVLIIAPVVDLVSRRRVQWFSWTALGLSVLALLTACMDTDNYALSLAATVDIALYLAAYFVRLRFMSRLAKSDDLEERTRYFVEEQMVATPALMAFLGLFALLGTHPAVVSEPSVFARSLADGFTIFFQPDQVGLLPLVILIGLLSQGTGIFGGLILLDRRENTFCVPVNRASSVLAGLLATLALSILTGRSGPPPSELLGAGLLISAIGVLSAPTLLALRQSARQG